MSRSDVAAALAQAGMPVVYYKWPEGAEPTFPCIRYVSLGSNDLYADNRSYGKVDRWSATLVSEWKDDASEAALEAALDGAGIAYAKQPDYYADSERLNHVEYRFELPR